ncbi:MAG: peptide-N-glycosidase F-related protein, partial [Myxococcota bacterium]
NGEPFEHVWEMKDEWDCAARVDQGVTPNQWGTWYFDRASWCPGFTAEMWKADLTRAFDFDGPNRLALQGTQSRAFPTTGGFPSTVWLLFRGGELADPVLRPVPRASCSNVDVRVRDFDDAFEDFLPLLARFDGLDADDPERTGAAGIVPGAVSGLLVDGVPALVWPEGTLPFTTADRFDQWFRDVDGVNLAVDVSDRVVQTHVDTAMVRGSATSPHTVAPIIDDAFGFGPDATGRNGTKTVTVTADFVHRPGVTLRFGSHDDMWVYVDGQLALDRGGFDGSLFSSSGPSRTDLLDLDTLDLTEGETYTLKAFLVDRSDNGSWQWWAEVPDCLP